MMISNNSMERGVSKLTPQLYFRVIVGAFLMLFLMSWSTLFMHISSTIHIHDGVTGGFVHISSVSQADLPLHVSDPAEQHLDSCHALDLAALSTMPVPSVPERSEIAERVVISQEVAAKQLEIVYLSQRALSRAPKNSPPYI